MNVDATIRLGIKKLRRQNSSIGDDNGSVGPMRREQLSCFWSFYFSWLMNGQSVLMREIFDRRLVQFPSAPRWLIRLGPYRDDLVLIVEQAAQGWHRRFRRAHEDKSHNCVGAGLVAARSFQKSGQAQGLPYHLSQVGFPFTSRRRLRHSCSWSRQSSRTRLWPA